MHQHYRPSLLASTALFLRGLSLASLVFLTSCATYSNTFQPIELALSQQQPDRALQEFEKRYSASGPDAALYYLNRGMLLRLNGRYQESNDAFEAAKRAMDKVEATSITEQATSFVVNDTVKAYEGEDFEKVLLHMYKALNYLELKQPYEARVEALQVDVKLRDLTHNHPDAVFTEEAFARYVTGIIYESLGEWSDAMIADRKAYDAFKQYQKKYGIAAPLSLQLALLRLAQQQGLDDELRNFQSEFKIDRWPSVQDRAALGEAIVTVHTGLAPLKNEAASNAIDPATGRLIRISLPFYRVRPTQFTQARLRIGDQTFVVEPVENINGLAVKTLESHMPAITARAIARAVAKYRMTKEAEKRDSALGLVMNVANFVTERADTRSWSTLPAQISLARAALAPGTYRATLELLDNTNHVIHTHDFPPLIIEAGKTTYLTFHWLSAS